MPNCKNLPIEERKKLFYTFLFVISAFLFCLTGLINHYLGNIVFPEHETIINNVKIDAPAVIIAPITEEIIKLLGYGIIFLFNFNKFFRLNYKNKSNFIADNLLLAFFISAGGFGFFEGFKNARFIFTCPFCIPSFIILNILIHITYSIYPLIVGKCYRNCFVAFLPIAMLLHSVHNFILGVFWDNKWVTFIMVTIFLLPLLIINRKETFSFLRRYFLKKLTNKQIFLLLLLIYFYIFLCCLLAF